MAYFRSHNRSGSAKICRRVELQLRKENERARERDRGRKDDKAVRILKGLSEREKEINHSFLLFQLVQEKTRI